MPSKRLLTENRYWWYGLLAIIASLLLLAWLVWKNTEELREQQEWVIHSNEVVRELETISRLASTAIISSRKFLNTPGIQSSVPAKVGADALQQAHAAHAHLARLVSDSSEQTVLAQAVGRTLQRLDDAIQSQTKIEVSSLAELELALEPADRVLQQLLIDVRSMRAHEERLLGVRVAKSQSIFRTTLLSQAAATLFAIFGALSSLYLAQRRYADHLKTAQAQARLDELNRFLIESSNDGVCGVDREGICTLINQAGAAMLGYRVEELVGQNFHDMVHQRHSDGTPYPSNLCPIYTAIQTGQSCRIDNEVFWHRNGEPISVEYSASPWVQHGVADGAVVSFSDVTQRKEAERHLEQARADAVTARESAEAANSAKSNFLASMSHELRTPLNAVIMYSEMLQEEASDMKLSSFTKDLSRIHTAGRHLLSLVNGVLDIAKIEAGKMELNLEKVPIEATLREVADTVRSLIDKNRNQLELRLDAAGTMEVDVTKLRQILFNLLSNSAKFTSDGKITLSVKEFTADEEPVDWLSIRVTDTGTGIAADKLDDLFKPFVQAEKTTAKEYGGTGLGLAISKQFCELMHGNIVVESQPGKGTTFEVRMPRNVGAVEELRARETRIAQSHSEVTTRVDVLIIDDDPATCEYVARTLAADGLTSHSAHDGASGLELAEQLQPRMIVLDVLLPKMDGWTVLSKLKEQATTSKIPVVLLTLVNQSELGFALGASEFISKPVTREQLQNLASKLGVGHDQRMALIVDDDAATREVLQRMLMREGWQVRLAEHGGVALEYLASDQPQPDMILLDLQMPVVDGFDFLTKVRELDRSLAAPIVVLTSRDLSTTESRWLSERVERILQKGGQSQSSLLKTLRSIIQEPTVA